MTLFDWAAEIARQRYRTAPHGQRTRYRRAYVWAKAAALVGG
jgi:hypothetical protein